MTALNRQQIGEIWRNFRVDKAQATVESDRVKILDDIAKSKTLQVMTSTVQWELMMSSQVEVLVLEQKEDTPLLRLLSSRINAAWLAYIAGYFPATKEHAQAAKRAAKQGLGKHVMTATATFLEALARAEEKKYEKAEKLHRKALEMRKELLGNEHQDVAESLVGLAVVLQSQDNNEEAAKLLQEGLDIQKKLFGNESSEVATTLDHLGKLQREEDKLTEAEATFREALEIRKKVLGPEHRDVAASLHNIGLALESQKKYADSESLFRHEIAMMKVLRLTAGDGERLIVAVKALARVLKKQKKYKASSAWSELASDMASDNQFENLDDFSEPGESDDEQDSE